MGLALGSSPTQHALPLMRVCLGQTWVCSCGGRAGRQAGGGSLCGRHLPEGSTNSILMLATLGFAAVVILDAYCYMEGDQLPEGHQLQGLALAAAECLVVALEGPTRPVSWSRPLRTRLE